MARLWCVTFVIKKADCKTYLDNDQERWWEAKKPLEKCPPGKAKHDAEVQATHAYTFIVTLEMEEQANGSETEAQVVGTDIRQTRSRTTQRRKPDHVDDASSRSPSPDIGSDFEETEKTRKTRRANKRYIETSTEEEDNALNQQFDEEASNDEETTRPTPRKKQKGARRTIEGDREDVEREEEEDDDAADEGIDDVDYSIVPGPLSAEHEKKVNELFAHVMQEAKSIAQDARKKPSQILDMICSSKTKSTQKLSHWDMFQTFFSAHVEPYTKGESSITLRYNQEDLRLSRFGMA